jgi:hypothetical protein
MMIDSHMKCRTIADTPNKYRDKTAISAIYGIRLIERRHRFLTPNTAQPNTTTTERDSLVGHQSPAGFRFAARSHNNKMRKNNK